MKAEQISDLTLESLFMILALDGTAGDSVELRRESTMCRL
jgi:hypothetical protein